MVKSGYEIYVDEEYLNDNIELGTINVENFYESLDQIDQYNLPEGNFYIKSLYQESEKIYEDRLLLNESFLDKMSWLVVNPRMNKRAIFKITKTKKKKS
jgi:hypothetical protein